ncbi:uncharacterized protein [Henckelia pumila]|uniref:uncharacterized protein n=1 Tax=Henckelia pumila TaxID=405737 RepID=UPI003C6E4A45
MSVYGLIQGQLLEITVVGCNKLRNTEWISRQDPYVCVDYACSKHRTRTRHGGGRDPTFQEKFEITLVEGLLEINITVWNNNKLTSDDFIGNGKVLLQGVLFQGYDDSCWPLQDRKGRHAGEVRLVMHYANAKKPKTPPAPLSYAATPPHPAALYPPPPYPQPLYHHHPSPYHPAYHATPSYPQQPPASYPPPPSSYPQQPPAYPPPPPSSYPQQPPAYPPPPPLYPQQPAAYPPPPPNPQYYYPQGTYPPPPHPQHHMF